jgi:hypothetical protein
MKSVRMSRTMTEPSSILQKLAFLTNTHEDDWEYLDGPDSGVGVDYWFRHRTTGAEAYANLDQDHLTVSVEGRNPGSAGFPEIPVVHCASNRANRQRKLRVIDSGDARSSVGNESGSSTFSRGHPLSPPPWRLLPDSSGSRERNAKSAIPAKTEATMTDAMIRLLFISPRLSQPAQG